MDYTCKDCDSFLSDGTCVQKEQLRDRFSDICPLFVTKDGRVPRFCRFAGSIDKMAELLIEQISSESRSPMYEVRSTGRIFNSKNKAKKAAKEWLLETAPQRRSSL